MTARLSATILCLEDDEDFLTELCEELRAQGYEVFGASNGAQVKLILDTLSEGRVSCVISDIMLPDRSGLDLIEHIRRHPAVAPRSPFLFLSALDTREDILKGLRAGADDYISKPVDLEILMTILRKRLEQSVYVPPTPDISLSRREREMLELLTAGHRSADMAQLLGLSPHTVNQYLKELYRKLGVKSRLAAIDVGRTRKLVTPPTD